MRLKVTATRWVFASTAGMTSGMEKRCSIITPLESSSITMLAMTRICSRKSEVLESKRFHLATGFL